MSYTITFKKTVNLSPADGRKILFTFGAGETYPAFMVPSSGEVFGFSKNGINFTVSRDNSPDPSFIITQNFMERPVGAPVGKPQIFEFLSDYTAIYSNPCPPGQACTAVMSERVFRKGDKITGRRTAGGVALADAPITIPEDVLKESVQDFPAEAVKDSGNSKLILVGVLALGLIYVMFGRGNG